MSIGQLLTDIGQGLVSIVPSFFSALWTAFYSLFLTYTEVENVITITGFNALGTLMLAFFIFYVCYRFVPMVGSFLKARISSRRVRRAGARK